MSLTLKIVPIYQVREYHYRHTAFRLIHEYYFLSESRALERLKTLNEKYKDANPAGFRVELSTMKGLMDISTDDVWSLGAPMQFEK
jgi:hypothetical protein